MVRWTDSGSSSSSTDPSDEEDEESDIEEYAERAGDAEQKFTAMVQAVGDAELTKAYALLRHHVTLHMRKSNRQSVAHIHKKFDEIQEALPALRNAKERAEESAEEDEASTFDEGYAEGQQIMLNDGLVSRVDWVDFNGSDADKPSEQLVAALTPFVAELNEMNVYDLLNAVRLAGIETPEQRYDRNCK